MLGYLVTGVIIGPGVLSLISGSKQVNNIAELGVVFLLFTIGLELSVDRLKVIRNQIFGVGTEQVVVTSVIIALIAWSVGFTPQCAVIIGGGLALSSTAVVLQLLSERGELVSRRGRLTFAILLLQDLAVVPLLALVPAFAGEGDDTITALLWTLGKALLLLAGVAVFGWFVVRPLFRAVAVGRSSELFAAVTLAVPLGMAWLTGTFGLSLAIGGLLAGLLQAETGYRHQVAADIQPFCGLLLGPVLHDSRHKPRSRYYFREYPAGARPADRTDRPQDPDHHGSVPDQRYLQRGQPEHGAGPWAGG